MASYSPGPLWRRYRISDSSASSDRAMRLRARPLTMGWSAGKAASMLSSSTVSTATPRSTPWAPRMKATSTRPSRTSSISSPVLLSSSTRRTCGAFSRKRRISDGTKGWKAAEPVKPTVSLPLSPSDTRRTPSTAWSTRARMLRASASRARPLSVSSMPRGSRWNSVTPSSCSSTRICWLSGGWRMPSRAAALVRWDSSATARK